MEWISSINWALHAKAFISLFSLSFLVAAFMWKTSLKQLATTLWWHVKDQTTKPNVLVEDIVLLSRLFPVRSPRFEPTIQELKHSFLKESFTLVGEGVLDNNTMSRILDVRIMHRFDFQMKQVERLKVMARFPAAFGLAGAVWFTAQGNVAGAGLLVLHSIFLSYFLFLSLADWLTEKIEDERRIWRMIAQGAKLVLTRTNPVTVAEELNSYLSPEQRVRLVYQSLPAGKKKKVS